MTRLAASEAQARAELQAATEREAALAAELAQTKAELKRGRPTFDALGERVSQMLGLAESEAEQMRADAARETAELREAAAKDAADIRSDARRDAEELGAAARRELLGPQGGAGRRAHRHRDHARPAQRHPRRDDEKWPSLAPVEETSPADLGAIELMESEGSPPSEED